MYYFSYSLFSSRLIKNKKNNTFMTAKKDHQCASQVGSTSINIYTCVHIYIQINAYSTLSFSL